jgi:hypothetical protein
MRTDFVGIGTATYGVSNGYVPVSIEVVSVGDLGGDGGEY